MEIKNDVILSVKNTVGYVEAKDKDSFMVGSQVAFRKSEEFYIPELERLKSEVDYWKSSHDEVRKDMKSIVDVFNKYDN